MSLWVLGTDTSVGKTVVSALILARYAGTVPIAYWKPISSGADDDRDRYTLDALVGQDVEILEESYHFPDPLSPHLAARLSGAVIDPDRILAELVRHGMERPERNLLIEGAGGLEVPLTEEGYLLIELVAETALPVLLVARSTLGTINHTLLSLEALRARHIPIAGVILNGPPNVENRKAIEKFGRVAIMGEVPPLVEANKGFHVDARSPGRDAILQAAETVDPRGALDEYLQGES